MHYREIACSSFDDCEVVFPCDYIESDCPSNMKKTEDEYILINIIADSGVEEDIKVINLNCLLYIVVIKAFKRRLKGVLNFNQFKTIIESNFEDAQYNSEIPDEFKEKLTIDIEEITVIEPITTTSTEQTSNTSTNSTPSPKKSFSVLEIIIFSIYGFLAFTAVVLPLFACRPKKNYAQFASFYLTSKIHSSIS